MTSNFLKRAEGDVHFICKIREKIAEAVDETIESGERVNLLVPVVAIVPDKFGDEPVFGDVVAEKKVASKYYVLKWSKQIAQHKLHV